MAFFLVRIVILSCVLKCYFSIDEGWFWHVTDFHWDTTYNNTGLTCKKQTERGEFGDFWCDSPWALIQSSVDAMKSFRADVDFILWTGFQGKVPNVQPCRMRFVGPFTTYKGDSVAHISNNDTTLQKNDIILGNITDLLHNSFPTVPMYATYGNHDYYPSNMFPPNGNELYNRTFNRWRLWITGAEQETSFRKGAYYTLKDRYGLRIVALNTNLYYKRDKVTIGLTDPADQFSWLAGVLCSAKAQNEKVIIIGHVPPIISSEGSMPFMQDNYHNKLNDIILNFTDVIVGMHFGHQHIDDLRMYYKSNVPAVVLFSAPSVTPWRYRTGEIGPPRNPAIRLVKYDRHSGNHLDVIQYYLDLSGSNSIHKAIWKMEYQMTKDYQLSDITPPSIHHLFKIMKNKDSAEFQSFYRWRTVNIDRTCDQACHLKVWCSLNHFRQNQFKHCLTPSNPDIIG